MSKPVGSDRFNTSIVREEEYLLLAEVMSENGSDVPTIVHDISFIDDCLTMRRMVHTIGRTKAVTHTKTGLLRKDTGYQSFINNRLNQLIEKK